MGLLYKKINCTPAVSEKKNTKKNKGNSFSSKSLFLILKIYVISHFN